MLNRNLFLYSLLVYRTAVSQWIPRDEPISSVNDKVNDFLSFILSRDLSGFIGRGLWDVGLEEHNRLKQ